VLGLGDQVGDLSIGKQFDALWLRPSPGSPLAVGLQRAEGPQEALARAFALGVSSDVAGVWVAGARLKADAELAVAYRNTET
jgi:guanine deaminase